MKKMMFNMVANDLGIAVIDRYEFMESATGEILSKEITLTVSIDVEMENIFDVIYPLVTDARVRSAWHGGATLQGKCGGDHVFIEMNYSRGYGRGNSDIAKEIGIAIFGNRKTVELISGTLERAMQSKHLAKILWWHNSSQRGPDTRTIYLPPLTTTLHPEFYPGMPSPSEYLKNYLDSDASILMLAGPPGTGKTTLLRHLICENKLSAHVVYDEHLMKSDVVFQDFLFGGDGDIMVIEDADALITSREHENNNLMSRFLNVSDGLIKLPNKKLVFTTNISDFNRVDNALLRPGRCFGIVHTRALNLAEAQAAAKVAGLQIPVENGEYTLAELFNSTTKHKPRSIGFVA